MPLPKPAASEEQEGFMIRCINDSIMQEEYPLKEQRMAVCYTQWRDRNKKPKNG
jgi:hypothetical protein